MKRKKVILFISSLGGGGAQRQIVLLACMLSRAYEVEVVIYHKDYQFKSFLDEAGINLNLIEKKRKIDLFFAFRIYKFFKNNKSCVLISYLGTPNLYARLLGRLAGVNKIITSERNVQIRFSKIRMFLEAATKNLNDMVVVNAEAISDIYKKDLGFSERKVKVIHNAVDFSKYHKVKKISTYEVNGERIRKKIICLPARIESQKNHRCLIKAFALLPAEDIESHILLFAGNIFNEKLKEELDNLAEDLNVKDKVLFAGPIKDMNLLYSMSDLVVLPSLYEGFPNAVVEAMACECVVIASNVSSNTDIIKDGVDGFLFDSNDEYFLLNKIRKALSMTDCAIENMSSMARKKVKSLCDPEFFLQSYVEIIED